MQRQAGVILMLVMAGCHPEPAPPDPVEATVDTEARARMVQEQLQPRGIHDPRVLRAMGQVPRHAFVPDPQRGRAYEDGPLPIGHGQTISQPYVVAFMTEALAPQPSDRVLEVGTGSGYQAAVLSGLVKEVFSIEVLPALARQAQADLAGLGFHNVQVRVGDGHLGWPEAAPFDAIIVTCAPEQVPPALVAQLKVGGRMIIPVGSQWGAQELLLLRKEATGLHRQAVLPVRFVPMVGGR